MPTEKVLEMWRFFLTNRTRESPVLSTKSRCHLHVSFCSVYSQAVLLIFAALDVETPKVPRLSFGLERVLFK